MEASAPATSKCMVKSLVILKNQATAVWSCSSCLTLGYLQISVAQPTETAIAVTICMSDKLLSSAPRHQYIIWLPSQVGKPVQRNVPTTEKDRKVIGSSGTSHAFGKVG